MAEYNTQSELIDIIENGVNSMKKRLSFQHMENNNKFSDLFESIDRLRTLIENQVTEPLLDGIPISQCGSQCMKCSEDNNG